MTLIFCKLLSAGLSLTHAVALTANIAVETGWSFDPEQRQYNNGPGWGLFQVEPTGLMPSLLVYADLADCKLEAADCQLAWMVDTLNGSFAYGAHYVGRGNIAKFNETSTVAEATRVFSEVILRPSTPHMDRRLEAARELYEQRGRHYCQH